MFLEKKIYPESLRNEKIQVLTCLVAIVMSLGERVRRQTNPFLSWKVVERAAKALHSSAVIALRAELCRVHVLETPQTTQPQSYMALQSAFV